MAPLEKALALNLEKDIYGSLAEIGAGQEVARYFFRARGTASTVAKTMSAYDMKFSDDIYGREDSGRYVVESRVVRMLDHEFNLLKERLSPTRGHNTRFFSFANTMAARSKEGNECHGWLGVRFQSRPNEPANQVILHVRMHDNSNRQQQEAIGILGVNLIHAAFFHMKTTQDFVSALTQNLSRRRVEIDMICTEGASLEHINNRLLSLDLIERGFTDAVLFGPNGEVKQPSEVFYQKPILIQRGSFRPFTNVNLDIINHGSFQFCTEHGLKKENIIIVNEITLQNLKKESKKPPTKDFLERVESLSSLGYYILVSNYPLFIDVKNYLRRFTTEAISILIGAGHLEKLFDSKHYSHLEGNILEAIGKLINGPSSIYVYPLHTEESCQTSQTFNPPPELKFLYDYLITEKKIVDLLGCDKTDISIRSSDVRCLLAQNDKNWEKFVPDQVAATIKNNGLFGYDGDKGDCDNN